MHMSSVLILMLGPLTLRFVLPSLGEKKAACAI